VESTFGYPSPDKVDYVLGVHDHAKGGDKLSRSFLAPKLASSYEFYAKKMREQYIEDGVLPTEIPVF